MTIHLLVFVFYIFFFLSLISPSLLLSPFLSHFSSSLCLHLHLPSHLHHHLYLYLHRTEALTTSNEAKNDITLEAAGRHWLLGRMMAILIP